ncbi:MAG TPA: ECF-type sigma factor, partial [Gemmataceae bacterium]|nr:ECF-type sigma factor [Gemmataceae bacterium]
MADVTQLLDAAAAGDPKAAAELLPLVYDELRKLAAAQLAGEKPGQTFQATALVHEAYIRLVGPDDARWGGRGHFFAAAAAMRRILIDSARRKASEKRGGKRQRLDLDHVNPAAPESAEELVALDESLERLAACDSVKAELVQLRFFAGLTMPQIASVLGISLTTAERYWVSCTRGWQSPDSVRTISQPRKPPDPELVRPQETLTEPPPQVVGEVVENSLSPYLAFSFPPCSNSTIRRLPSRSVALRPAIRARAADRRQLSSTS